LAIAIVASLPLVIEGRYYSVVTQAEATMDENALAQAQLAGKYLILDPYYQWHVAHLYLQFAQSKEDASYARESAKIAKRALGYSPHSPELLYMLGSAQLLAGQYGKEERALRQARHYLSLAKQKAPLFIKIQEELLLVDLQMQDYAGAKQTAQSILVIDDNNAIARSAKLVAVEKTKDKN
jgi:tetratricopeptide (TPR) repeat protein